MTDFFVRAATQLNQHQVHKMEKSMEDMEEEMNKIYKELGVDYSMFGA